MNRINSLQELPERLRALGRRLRIAVVSGTDGSTLEAVARAVAEGFAEALMVGDEEAMRHTLAECHIPTEGMHFVPAADAAEAATLAVAAVRRGEADILMKGLISTGTLLRAVLNKETGLLPRGAVLSHVSVSEWPQYGKLLFYSDVAVIPYPTLEQRSAEVGYLVDTCRAFGIDEPRVALLHCSETVSEHFPHTLDYARIKEEALGGRWGRVIVDGPLDLRTTMDASACCVKGIDSPLGGCTDALVFPDLEAGNTFYKAMTFLVGAETAGILVGTTHPVVLPSRGDNAVTKFYSLALAALKHIHQCAS